MKTGRDQYLQALASLRELTRTQAERVAGLLAKHGEAQAGQANRIAEDLLRRTRKNREQLSRLIEREVKRQLELVWKVLTAAYSGPGRPQRWVYTQS